MDSLQHRRGEARLRLVNREGSAAANALLRLKLKRHSFLFGTGMFDAIELCDPNTGEERREFLRRRLEKLQGVFNYATLPFYWGRFEKEEGQPDTQRLLAAARWLKGRGVALKGHPLCWHTVCAPWLLKYDDETILNKQLARIRREVEGFRGLIDRWDVINEVVIMPVFDRYDNAVTRLCRHRGQVGLTKMVFDEAKKSSPGATLLLNDFNTSPAYENLIERCLDAGVPIDVIGIQSHQHQGYWGREKLEEVLSRFSRFGLPIHFTENTLISGELMPRHIEDLNDWVVPSWPTTPEGEERQARQMEEMYRVLFAHPLVEAITNWDAVDGCWLGAPSGVLRADNTPKPAFEMLDRLIHEEWGTELELRTDGEGFTSFTGMLGSYEIDCGGKTLHFELSKENQETIHLTL